MRFVLAIFILLVPTLSTFADDELLGCNVIGSKSPELRLKRHLLCEYDPSVRPAAGVNATVNVTLSLMPTLMEFEDRNDLLLLHSWIFMKWKDEHLKWNLEDFEGISTLHIKSEEIWIPDFSFYTAGKFGGSKSLVGIPPTVCQLQNTGEVVCVPAIKMSSLCKTSYAYWPYDSQVCELEFGSWAHNAAQIDVYFGDIPISLKHYMEHKEWRLSLYTFEKVVNKFSCCPNESFASMSVILNLDRHSPMLHSVYVSPIIVLMAITLIVLWLDSRSKERIFLGGLNFICHLMGIYNLHWMLPANGSDPPHILLFYRDSMLLASFAMIVTSLLRKLQSTKAAAPSWIVSTVTLVANNRAGRYLLLDAGAQQAEDEAQRDVEENSEATLAEGTGKPRPDTWRKLSVIVEWLSFFVCLLSYGIMICVLVPKSGVPAKTKFFEAT